MVFKSELERPRGPLDHRSSRACRRRIASRVAAMAKLRHLLMLACVLALCSLILVEAQGMPRDPPRARGVPKSVLGAAGEVGSGCSGREGGGQEQAAGWRDRARLTCGCCAHRLEGPEEKEERHEKEEKGQFQHHGHGGRRIAATVTAARTQSARKCWCRAAAAAAAARRCPHLCGRAGVSSARRGDCRIAAAAAFRRNPALAAAAQRQGEAPNEDLEEAAERSGPQCAAAGAVAAPAGR